MVGPEGDILFTYKGYSDVRAQNKPRFNKQATFRRKRGAGRVAGKLLHWPKHGVTRVGNTVWQLGCEKEETCARDNFKE